MKKRKPQWQYRLVIRSIEDGRIVSDQTTPHHDILPAFLAIWGAGTRPFYIARCYDGLDVDKRSIADLDAEQYPHGWPPQEEVAYETAA